jgi:hypothetical protein
LVLVFAHKPLGKSDATLELTSHNSIQQGHCDAPTRQRITQAR